MPPARAAAAPPAQGMIAGLVLAAGAGSRFGGRKQLAELRGRPLLEHALAAMGAARLHRVVVVLGADADLILARADLRGARAVVCPDWAEGQATSLRAGLDAVGEVDAVVVALGDQPLLSPFAMTRVVAARAPEADAVRATYAGVAGHPVLLERRTFPRLRALRGDTGARELLRDLRVLDIPCDGLGRPDDVDTPEQLEVLTA